MCYREMDIIRWESSHIHKDAAERGCCLCCLCRQILQILSHPCLACQQQPAQLVSESGKQGLCSVLFCQRVCTAIWIKVLLSLHPHHPVLHRTQMSTRIVMSIDTVGVWSPHLRKHSQELKKEQC